MSKAGQKGNFSTVEPEKLKQMGSEGGKKSRGGGRPKGSKDVH